MSVEHLPRAADLMFRAAEELREQAAVTKASHTINGEWVLKYRCDYEAKKEYERLDSLAGDLEGEGRLIVEEQLALISAHNTKITSRRSELLTITTRRPHELPTPPKALVHSRRDLHTLPPRYTVWSEQEAVRPR